MSRTVVLGARRVVIKVGSSSLTTAKGGLDLDRLRDLVDAVAQARGRGTEVVLVSSGAIAAGLSPLKLARRPRDLAGQQAAASVGQGLLARHYAKEFERHHQLTGQVLLTVEDVTRRSHYRNAQRTFEKLLDLGVLPIVNENDTVATSEIRFGDNDRLAALVAHLVHADLLLLLTDVEGLYDAPPSRPGSQLIPEVHGVDDLQGLKISGSNSHIGSGGMHTKLDAARIATGAGIHAVLTNALLAGDALAGAEVGTLFHPTGRRRSTRLLWLAHASVGKGSLVLDDGAVAAIKGRRASLLPAGITGVRGTFAAGDPVDIVDAQGRGVARGLVNYDSTELPGLFGRSTRDLARELGAAYEREVVHRDDMVIL